jgi:hypothetical protein
MNSLSFTSLTAALALAPAAAKRQAAQQAQRDPFRRGFGACLESKGYSVK